MPCHISEWRFMTKEEIQNHFDQRTAAERELLERLNEADHTEALSVLETTMGEAGTNWLLRRSIALGDRPINLLLAGRDQEVVELLWQLHYGVYI
jgi:hypothetical protein